MSDTAPSVEKRYREMLMRLPPEQRLLQSCRMFTTTKRLTESSIRSKHTGRVDDETLRRELFLRFYGTNVPDGLRAIVLMGRKVHYTPNVDYSRYPGGDLVERGLKDLKEGRESVDSLLVSIGAPRLRRLGFDIERPFPSAEHRLYGLLAEEEPDSAHSRYNALIRRLVSFERALECAA